MLKGNEKVADVLVRFGEEDPSAGTFTKLKQRKDGTRCGACAYGKLADALLGDATLTFPNMHGAFLALGYNFHGQSGWGPFREEWVRSNWDNITIQQLVDGLVLQGLNARYESSDGPAAETKNWDVSELMQEIAKDYEYARA